MGMFFFNGYMEIAKLEENFLRSLRIEGQVAVADLAVKANRSSLRDPVTVQARLDFSGVSDTQMLIWATCTKMTDIHRAIRTCSRGFLDKFSKQGTVCCPAATAETMFIVPDAEKKGSSFKEIALEHDYDEEVEYEYEYFLCLNSIEGHVAVIDSIVLYLSKGKGCLCEDKKLREHCTNAFQIRLDFSDVSETQMLLWAARTKMIDLQHVLYRCDEHDGQFLADLVKQGKPVCRHASEAGNPFDDAAKKQQHVMTTAKDMSAEERAALIKLLQEMDNK